MPTLTTTPLLVGGTGQTVSGRVAIAPTATYEFDGQVVTTTPKAGVVKDGQFFAADGYSPLTLLPTPEGIGMRLALHLEAQTGAGLAAREHAISRTVAVPNQATVAWDDLVDVVPVVEGGDYIVPPWAASVLEARDEAVGIADTMVVDGDVVGDSLILTRQGGGTINAGTVKGSKGDQGDQGLPGLDAVPQAEGMATHIASPGPVRDALLESFAPLSVLNLAPKPPAGFRGLTALPTPTIRRGLSGGFTADESVFDALMPTGGGTFYTAPNAPAAGSGTSVADPRTLSTLINNVPDGATIVLADGTYARHECGLSATQTKSFRLVAAPGATPKVTGFEKPSDLTWTSTSGHIYQTTRSATASVLDVVNLTDGDYTRYEQMADLASITGPGQYAVAGSIVYVWALGDTNLVTSSTQIRLQVLIRGGVVIAGAGNVAWVEGIEFLGCGTASSGSFMGGLIASGGATIVAKDCTVAYNTVDGPATKSGGHLVAIRTESRRNGLDGFNYHNTSGDGGEFIEIDCSSHHNGNTPGASTNNATTAHEAITGIRVNGDYYAATGPVVADVNRAHSWNLGCRAGGSAIPVAGAQDSSWRVDATGYDADPAQMWLDECVADTAAYAFRTSGTGGVIRTHATGWANDARAWSGSNVQQYVR